MSESRPSSLLRRMLRTTATLVITSVFIGIAGVSVWQGQAVLSDRAMAVEKPDATAPLAVSASAIDMQDGYSVDRSFTGQIEALQTADLGFEQGGTLAAVLVDEGDTVRQGQTVARLDDRLLQADIDRLSAAKAALEAQLELASLTDERQAELQRRGFASAQTADQTRLSIVEINARIAETDAAMLAAQIRLEKTAITAPFDGVVNARLVDPGNTVGGGQAVLSLVQAGDPVFRVGIDPRLADRLELDQTLTVSIGGTDHDATLIAILPEIDPATRTRTVRARLEAADSHLAFGETGELTLTETIAEPGAWVPLTAIEDGVRGLWTIKTVNPAEDDAELATVGTEAIEIIHGDATRAFVRGTFDAETRFIDEGVHRVVAGQTVRLDP